MDIQEKQATWNKERPLFEADFVHSHLLPFFNFNENTGDYEIKSEFAEDEDRKVAFETLNTGWAMWLRAKRGAKAEIDPIFDIFHIGSNARNIRTLQVNIKNSSRRSDCLSQIENIVTETLISNEPESYGEEYQESLLNWGESPDQYESRFKAIWDAKQAEIDELKAKLEKICKWSPDKDLNWWTQCGNGFVFGDDPHPTSHNFKHCCYCGGMIEAAQGEE